MPIYSIVNVKTLKFDHLSMLDEDEEGKVLPSIQELVLSVHIELQEDMIY